jgi:anti-sigma-K factor RskA
MPPTPVDDHTEDFEQLAALQALDVLEGGERQRFEQHAAHCQRCRVMVQLDREALARAAPEMDPSPGFKTRLMQRATEELQELQARRRSAPPQPTPTPPNVIPFRRRAPWLSAIAAVLVVGLVIGGGYAYQNQVVASYPLTGSLAGSAVVNVRRSGATELAMRGVQDPPAGYLYEAWIIPPSPNSQPVAAGVTSTGNATLPLAPLANGSTVALTQEPGRVEAPTSPPVMAVVVRS